MTRRSTIPMCAVFALMASSAAQNTHVRVAKRVEAVAPACRSVAAASIADPVDVRALIKEAACKGAGQMLIDYTYSQRVLRREKDKGGNLRERSTDYEVYIPTLKSGQRAEGVLLVTARDGEPLSPREMEAQRRHAGEELEKREKRIAAQPDAAAVDDPAAASSLQPVGMYGQMGINLRTFGLHRGQAQLGIGDFLRRCDFKFLRREARGGRDVLVLSFSPNPEAPQVEGLEYMSQLRGLAWIDASERIVTRLEGWPADIFTGGASQAPDTAPAVLIEMARLPEGVWLPLAMRVNGAQYPKLFDHITIDFGILYSNYARFATEIKEVKIIEPKP